MIQQSNRPPRKKSCQQCSKVKVRCDHAKPRCSRCTARQLNCIYVKGQHRKDGRVETNAEEAGSGSTSTVQTTEDNPDNAPIVGLQASVLPTPISTAERSLHIDDDLKTLDFSNVLLRPAIDDWRVRSRWMESILPSANETVKNISPTVVSYSREILKSYPKMLQDGRLPPFIHKSQANQHSVALTNAINITRMWDSRCNTMSSILRDIIEREVSRLLEDRESWNHLEQLTNLQTFLILAILLLLCDSPNSVTDSPILVQLQDMTADVANTGVLSEAEITGSRPDWETWILAAAKRRTIFAAYMFDNVVSFSTGLPSVVATELACLPVPASKTLWETTSRASWNKEYNRHLARWEDGELVIGELRNPPNLDKASQEERIRRWLADVDDFGMMHFAITTMIYGSS